MNLKNNNVDNNDININEEFQNYISMNKQKTNF